MAVAVLWYPPFQSRLLRRQPPQIKQIVWEEASLDTNVPLCVDRYGQS